MRVIKAGDATLAPEELIPARALELVRANHQKAIPAIARDPILTRAVEKGIRHLPTHHTLVLGDSRNLDDIADAALDTLASEVRQRSPGV